MLVYRKGGFPCDSTNISWAIFWPDAIGRSALEKAPQFLCTTLEFRVPLRAFTRKTLGCGVSRWSETADFVLLHGKPCQPPSRQPFVIVRADNVGATCVHYARCCDLLADVFGSQTGSSTPTCQQPNMSRCRGVEVSRCRGVEVSRCRALLVDMLKSNHPPTALLCCTFSRL